MSDEDLISDDDKAVETIPAKPKFDREKYERDEEVRRKNAEAEAAARAMYDDLFNAKKDEILGKVEQFQKTIGNVGQPEPEVELHVESEYIKQKVYLLSIEQETGAGVDVDCNIGIFSRYALAHAKAEEIAQDIAKEKGIGRTKFEIVSDMDGYRTLEARCGPYHVATFHISKMVIDE